eukprot:8116502-Heterocapsa_arctica.AAC.1
MTDGYDTRRKPVNDEMTENPVFSNCYETRCLEWFHTTRPTDEHLVPDNALPNDRRLGSYLAAKAMLLGAAPVPVTGMEAAPKAKGPGASRPTSP